jgi:hypothetical protein
VRIVLRTHVLATVFIGSIHRKQQYSLAQSTARNCQHDMRAARWRTSQSWLEHGRRDVDGHLHVFLVHNRYAQPLREALLYVANDLVLISWNEHTIAGSDLYSQRLSATPRPCCTAEMRNLLKRPVHTSVADKQRHTLFTSLPPPTSERFILGAANSTMCRASRFEMKFFQTKASGFSETLTGLHICVLCHRIHCTNVQRPQMRAEDG